MRYFLIVLGILLAVPLTAKAERKLGLVIGNDAYTDVPELSKAAADAESIAEALGAQGFEILIARNVTRREMNRRISEFTGKLEPGDTALIFFAGHGVEIDGQNYLLPTDISAPKTGEQDFIKSESIALSVLLDRIRSTGARTTIAIIDACRNNPFATTNGRSIGGKRGLGRITAPQGTFVIFSAGAGQVALDELNQTDTANNSVFTRALLPRLSRPGLELRALMADLRVEVRDLARTVNHQQFPAYYDELLGQFYFAAAPTSQPIADVDAPVSDPMRADFDLARSLGTKGALESFLERYSARKADFTYQMAKQLLAEVPDQPKKSIGLQSAASQPVSRSVIRATQDALNQAGCSAGGADGVIGPRTQRAFTRFIADSGARLKPSDLGTDRGLQAVRSAGPTGCKTIAAAAPKSSASQKIPDSPAPLATKSTNLAGSWRYKATCALLVKVTGAVRFTKAGQNFYQGKLSDSLGQQANTEVYLNGRDITGTDYFPGIIVKWRGRLAADGSSYTASGSTGCSVYAWKTG